MKRSWLLLPVFAACLAVVFAALAWTSAAALRLEAEAARAAAQAAQEEDVRLALWRIDSALGNLLAQENARPPFTYRAFYPAQRPYAPRSEPAAEATESLVPSPLLSQVVPHALLYFEIDPAGAVSSPQAPRDAERERALAAAVSAECLDDAAQKLDRLRPSLVREELVATLPHGEVPMETDTPTLPVEAPAPRIAGRSSNRQSTFAQQTLNTTEFQARAQTNLSNMQGNTIAYLAAGEGVWIGPLTPLWRGERLLLVRRVAIQGSEWLQGVWLDWESLRGSLAASIRDLLPSAQLEPAPKADEAAAPRLLTALPSRLVVDAPLTAAGGGASPLRISLILAWTCAILAAVAVALLLWGVVSLSERRAAFVSAVTHELRTPLTTLRMYAEMLAGGMVPSEGERHYLGTLRGEADRLGHLVENVLAYARLERAPRTRFAPLPVDELLGRVSDRLGSRAAQCGLRLETSVADEAAAAMVAVDPAAVEQILFNLVDNACKHGLPEGATAVSAGPGVGPIVYAATTAGINPAAGAPEATSPSDVIRLDVTCRGPHVLLRVRDGGPGISIREARRLFRPFSRSARQAAGNVPGVGLGLALCRRLARQLGGDVRLENPGEPDASFVVSLPSA